MSRSLKFLSKFSTIKRILFFALAQRNKIVLGMLKVQPGELTIVLTDNCNSRCIMCNDWQKELPEELPFGVIKDLLQQAAGLGIKNVTLYGGEPLLHSDISEIVKEAKINHLHVSIITNALLLTSKKAEELVKNGLDKVNISMDAFGDLNNQIRGIPNAFERSVSAIQYLRQAGEKYNRSIDISIGSLVMKPTLVPQGIPAVINLCQAMNVPFSPRLIDFNIPYLRETKPKEELWIGPKDYIQLDELVDKLIQIKKDNPAIMPLSIPAISFIGRYFRDPKSKKIPCCRGFLGEILVNANGDVHTCAVLPSRGNIRNTRLDKIAGSTEWKKQVQRMFMKDCSGCSCNFMVNVESSMSFIYWKLAEKVFWPGQKDILVKSAYYYPESNINVQRTWARYNFVLPFIKGKKILDLGCGARKGPCFLARKAKEVIGADSSMEAIYYAREKWQSKNLSYLVMDAVDLKFDNDTFDAVVSFEVIEHVFDYRKYLMSVKRVLKSGGIAVLSTPNKIFTSPNGQPATRGHIKEFYVQEFEDLLSEYFTQLAMYGLKKKKRVYDTIKTEKAVYSLTNLDFLRLRRLVPKAGREFINKGLNWLYSRLIGNPLSSEINQNDFEIVQKDSLSDCENIIAVCEK